MQAQANNGARPGIGSVCARGLMLLAEEAQPVRGEGCDGEDSQQPVRRVGEFADEQRREQWRPLSDRPMTRLLAGAGGWAIAVG